MREKGEDGMLEFLTKFDFLNRIFRRGESRSSAKERLRLVLIHDRASVTPQVMESLKEDLISVISRYLEIDVTELEIGLEQKDGSIALAANIPIKKVRHTPLPREQVEAGLARGAAMMDGGKAPESSEPTGEGDGTGHVRADIEPAGAAVSGAEAEPADGKKDDESAPAAGTARINAADRKKSGSRSKRRSKMKRLSEVKKRESSAEHEKIKGEKL
jgi:cell division topological specificity factor